MANNEKEKQVAPEADPEITEQGARIPDPTQEASEPEERPEADDAAPVADAEPEQQADKTAPFEDEETANAIDDIAATNGEDLLAVQDEGGGSSRAHRGFFRSKLFRWGLFFVVFAAVVAGGVVPSSRYFVLNTGGVRVGATVTIIDDATQLPLKGVAISIDGKHAATDSKGTATLSGLKLGPQTLMIEQTGFGQIKRPVILGWGSNPFDPIALKAVGIHYIIEAKDYLSEKPVAGVEASNGDVTAVSDKDGKITLTLPNTVVAADPVTLTKDGYRSEQITLGSDPKTATKAAMVVAQKTVFVSKQSGTYDVYKADIDGKNREVLLSGTGSETSNVSLVVSPDGKRAAYVSTRGNKKDSDGFLLSSLVLINIESGENVTIAESPQIQLTDWVGSRLVFEQVSADDTSANRYTIISYDYTNNTRLQLASANKLNAVLTAQNNVYYALPAGASAPAGLYRIGVDGNGKQQVFKAEAEAVLRTAYNTFSLQAADGTWSSYNIPNGSTAQIATPSSLTNRLYIDTVDRKNSLWVNQGALTLHDVAKAKDTVLQTKSGLAYPVQWLTSTIAVFRIATGSETADYVMSIEGGTAHKVADVVAAYGFAHTQ